MDAPEQRGYQPPPNFVEDKRDSLIDIRLTDSIELWLIQWPINQTPDFDGQQVSLNLNSDGYMGTIEGSSGKSFDVVSLNYQGPEARVLLSSASGTKIVGKISRRVSLVHYPEPSELPKRNIRSLSHSQRSSAATSTISGRRTETPRSSRPVSGYSTPSGRTKSTVNDGSVGHSSKASKRKRVEEQRRSVDHSGQSSGKGNSGITSSGSKGHSEERKSKKNKKSED